MLGGWAHSRWLTEGAAHTRSSMSALYGKPASASTRCRLPAFGRTFNSAPNIGDRAAQLVAPEGPERARKGKGALCAGKAGRHGQSKGPPCTAAPVRAPSSTTSLVVSPAVPLRRQAVADHQTSAVLQRTARQFSGGSGCRRSAHGTTRRPVRALASSTSARLCAA
jgi:hypothetical protein